jgi:methyl-accepting chemotaxis protein
MAAISSTAKSRPRFSLFARSSDPLDNPRFVLSLVEHMAVPIFVLDAAGKVMIWNAACEKLTGIAASDVVGTKDHWKGFYTVARPCLADLVVNGGNTDVAALYVAHDNQGSDDGRMTAQNWCELPHAGRRYLTFDAVPIRDAEGKLSAVIETLQDLTTLKQAEEDVGRAKQATEDAVRQERAIVTEYIGTGLAKLAAKDLTYRMTAALPESYQKLQMDFNAAMGQLEAAMQRVTEQATTIHAATEEISTAVNDLSRRSEQQAASLEQSAAALDETTETVKKSAEGADHASQIVAHAAEGSKKSAAVVGSAIEAMDMIAKSAQQISQIIAVIDGIAFQTNLLALNAGVEAARAGDAGRGFAVVASEVRALAQRSAEAAKEIKALISASTTEVEHGVDLVAQTGKSLEWMMAQVNEIDQVVGGISAGAKAQAIALGEVSSAINQMDQITQQNAAMVEESTAATHSLLQEIGELSEMVGQFTLSATQDSAALRRELQNAAPHVFRAMPNAKTQGRGRRNV